MRTDKRFRLLILGVAVVSIFTLSIVFAVVSQTLTISTDVEVMPAALNVEFDESLTESHAFNGAEVISEGTIEGTTITGLSVRLMPEGSYVKSYFTAVNNSENADVVLSNISLISDNDNFPWHIKLMHYIDENETHEIDLTPMISLEPAEALGYMLENFSSGELADLGFGALNNGLENLTEEDLGEIQTKMESMKASVPNLVIKVSNLRNDADYLYEYQGSDFNSAYANRLYSVNNASSDEDSKEVYELYISAYQPTEINLDLPEGYYLKYTDINIAFTYQQAS